MSAQRFLTQVFAIGIAISTTTAEAKEKVVKAEAKNTTQEFMQSKRIHMHELFDAVLAKDFEKSIEKSKVLMMLSQASTWHQIESEEYKNYTKKFQDAVKIVIAKSEAKSNSGLAQAYADLTMACAKCHHEVRWK